MVLKNITGTTFSIFKFSPTLTHTCKYAHTHTKLIYHSNYIHNKSVKNTDPVNDQFVF